MSRQYIFGPVASRRLGVSLGIDLVEPKTCPQNCVYCEAGATTLLTMERREYVPVATVLAQLDLVLRSRPPLDYVTFSGSGEPTLHSKIGEVVAFLKTRYPEYRICLLTNGMLLGDRALRREIAAVDLVVPSLDASCRPEFEQINRPVAAPDFDVFVANLIDFCRNRTAETVLELFVVPGVNDSEASLERFAAIIRQLNVGKVQLNTLDRPGCVEWIRPATSRDLGRFIRALEPFVPVEAVGVYRYKSPALHKKLELSELDKRILDYVLRRPATVADLVVALGCDAAEIQRAAARLVDGGQLQSERLARGEFFSRGGQSAG